jgi:hypothetical protein
LVRCRRAPVLQTYIPHQEWRCNEPNCRASSAPYYGTYCLGSGSSIWRDGIPTNHTQPGDGGGGGVSGKTGLAGSRCTRAHSQSVEVWACLCMVCTPRPTKHMVVRDGKAASLPSNGDGRHEKEGGGTPLASRVRAASPHPYPALVTPSPSPSRSVCVCVCGFYVSVRHKKTGGAGKAMCIIDIAYPTSHLEF